MIRLDVLNRFRPDVSVHGLCGEILDLERRIVALEEKFEQTRVRIGRLRETRRSSN